MTAVAASSHVEGTTQPCILRFVNKGKGPVKLLWVDFDGQEKEYNELAPGHAYPQRASPSCGPPGLEAFCVRGVCTVRTCGDEEGTCQSCHVQKKCLVRRSG